MPAFDVARRRKGRVVLDRSGEKLGLVLDVFYGLSYTGASRVDEDEDDEDAAVAQIRGTLPEL